MGVLSKSECVEALQHLDYTHREAEFLALAALHSGYFLRRQYEAFIAAPRGRPADRFLRRVVSLRHARSVVYANRTEIFHVFARRIYRAIGDEDNRNRRPRPHFATKAKLMALDFVLANRERRFLGTEGEKLSHFCEDLGIERTLLPAKTYRSNSSSERNPPLLCREVSNLRFFCGRTNLRASDLILLCRRGRPFDERIHILP